jgi:hypothetical protein
MTAPMPRIALAAALVLCGACATPPPPTAAARRLAQNPRATVAGRVTDTEGRPVVGARVEAVPGGKDILWSTAAPTDAEGRFRLSLDAPAEYVFLVYVDSVAVLTPSPQDPGRVRIFVDAGETREGVELTLLRAEREKLIEPGD